MKKVAGLDLLVPGEKGIVHDFATDASQVRQRLMEMGLTKGTAITVIRLAPLGDPIEIEVRGYRLSLRRKEAAAVVICTDERSSSFGNRVPWGQDRTPEET